MATATQATRTEALARALARADEHNIRVCGEGSRKSDGARVIATTSSTGAAEWHLVAVLADRLECDCKAGQRGQVCMHRACVHRFLRNERDAAREAAILEAEREAEVAADRRAALERETAPMASRPAFSMWK